MTPGLYVLRVSPYRILHALRGRRHVVRAVSAIEPGAIVMLQHRAGFLVPRTAIRAAMRIESVRTVVVRGERRLELTAASAWRLARPFTLLEALGPRASYDRECPLVRLSAEHEHTIRSSRWLGAEVGPVDHPELDERVRALFLTLWDKAGTTQYDKSEWNELRHLLHRRGIEV